MEVIMDAVSLEHEGLAPEAKEQVRRVEVRKEHYALEVFEDHHGETWVRVRAGSHVSAPIPFADFVVGNQ
jgi:hypothetical protein